MGSWRRWWWTGVLVAGTAVNCGKSSIDATDPKGAAGESASGAPNAIGGGGAVIDDGAAGGDTDTGLAGGGLGSLGDAGGDGGRAGGGGGGLDTDFGGQPPISIELPEESSVVATDCSGAVGGLDVEPALARFCLLDSLCLGYELAECVWFRHRFDAAGACATEVATCAELEACAGRSSVSRPDSCELESEQGCSTPGLECQEVTDPHNFKNPTKPLCVPAGCDYDTGEIVFPRCAGDDVIEETYVYYMRYVSDGLPDAEIHANVRLHCPAFGFTTCLDGRCVH